MNINDKLYEGQRLGNYKELCGVLGWTVTTGNGKIAQLKELERYVTFRKEGQAYIIEDIQKTPKERVDGRINNGRSSASHGNNSKYITLIKPLLMTLICKKVEGTEEYMRIEDELEVSYSQLMRLLGMVEGVYPQKVEEIEVYEIIYPSLYSMLRGCLETMQKNDLIEIEKVVTYADQYLIDMVPSTVTRYPYCVASKEETENIYEVEKNATLRWLSEHDKREYKTERDVMVYNRRNTYYNMLNYLLKKKHGWMNVRILLQITPKYSEEGIGEEFDEYILTKDQKLEFMKKLNELCVEKSVKAIEKEYLRRIKRDDDYVEKQLQVKMAIGKRGIHHRYDRPEEDFISKYSNVVIRIVSGKLSDF